MQAGRQSTEKIIIPPPSGTTGGLTTGHRQEQKRRGAFFAPESQAAVGEIRIRKGHQRLWRRCAFFVLWAKKRRRSPQARTRQSSNGSDPIDSAIPHLSTSGQRHRGIARPVALQEQPPHCRPSSKQQAAARFSLAPSSIEQMPATASFLPSWLRQSPRRGSQRAGAGSSIASTNNSKVSSAPAAAAAAIPASEPPKQEEQQQQSAGYVIDSDGSIGRWSNQIIIPQ